MKNTILILFLVFSAAATAQVKMGDDNNPTAVETSALLQIESSARALVVTRVATTAAIISPVNGMIVYVLADNKFKIYQSNAWYNLFN